MIFDSNGIAVRFSLYFNQVTRVDIDNAATWIARLTDDDLARLSSALFNRDVGSEFWRSFCPDGKCGNCPGDDRAAD